MEWVKGPCWSSSRSVILNLAGLTLIFSENVSSENIDTRYIYDFQLLIIVSLSLVHSGSNGKILNVNQIFGMYVFFAKNYLLTSRQVNVQS